MTCHLFRCAAGALGWGNGTDPGGHGVVDGPDADRVRLVPARGGQPGEAAAVLRPPVPAGRGGRHLLRAARRADRPGLGGADPGRVHLQRQGVQPVHPAPDAGPGAARRPARGREPVRQGPGVPQGRRPGGGRSGLGPVPGRARAAAARRASSARSCCSSRPGSRSAGPQGLHPVLRAAGRAAPGLRGVPQPHLDDRGQPARDPGLPRRAPAAVRVRGHAAGLPELHPAGAGRHQRPGRGPDARALGQVGQQGYLTSGSATGTAKPSWPNGRARLATWPGRPTPPTCCSTTATATTRRSTPSSSRALLTGLPLG